MGFQYRKRSGGKNAWLNTYASKRGVGVSASVKSGNLTINRGKGRARVTMNFGNGLRYVEYGKSTSECFSKTTDKVFPLFVVFGGFMFILWIGSLIVQFFRWLF